MCVLKYREQSASQLYKMSGSETTIELQKESILIFGLETEKLVLKQRNWPHDYEDCCMHNTHTHTHTSPVENLPFNGHISPEKGTTQF